MGRSGALRLAEEEPSPSDALSSRVGATKILSSTYQTLHINTKYQINENKEIVLRMIKEYGIYSIFRGNIVKVCFPKRL